MPTPPPRTPAIVMLACGVLLAGSLSLARQPESPAQQPESDAADVSLLPRQWLELPAAERRQRFRDFVASRLDRAERTQQALADALKAVDDGAPLDQVIADYPADLRAGFWGGPGAGGRGEGGRGEGRIGGRRGPGNPAAPSPASDENFNELGPVMPDNAGDQHQPPPRGRGERDESTPITDAEREAFDDFLASAAPGVHRMMRELRSRDPDRADRKLREGLPRIRWLMDLRQRDPEAYRLRLQDIRHGREAFDAARDLAAYDREHTGDAAKSSAERQELTERVRTALRDQYEVRGKLLEHEITRLDQDLSKRRSELAGRTGGREAAIGRGFDKLRERARDWLRNPHGRAKGKGEQPPPEGP